MVAGRYRIENLIGTGGFAKVFRATHTGTGQCVALKVLDGTGLGDDVMMLRRFFREARASASLRHPNTVRVFDFGQEEDGTVYLAMELLTGRTLRAEQKSRLAASGSISEVEAVSIAIAVAQSLSEAHCLGLVHRDIGPNNIFLHEVAGSEPVVKVLDFGLVKDGGQPLTRANQLFGTAAYMSPEQALGRRGDAKSDLYSLGILMWWMIAGSPPFAGGTPKEVMRCHVTESVPPLNARGGVPVSNAFEAVIACATAKDPIDRYADAQEMRRALESCRDELARHERSPTLVAETMLPEVKTPRRWKRAALISGTISILAMLVTLTLAREEPQPVAIPRAPTPASVETPAIVATPPPAELEEPSEPAAPPIPDDERPAHKRKPTRSRRSVRRVRPPAVEPDPPAPPPSSILTTPI